MFGERRVAAARVAAAMAAMAIGTGVTSIEVQHGGTAAQAASAGLTGPLAVSGTHVVDLGASSRSVVLQGVDILAEATGTTVSGLMDDRALATVEDWGASDIRVQVSSDAVLHECSNEVYDPNYASELSGVVSQLTGHGIYVILDVEQTNPGCHFTSPQGSAVAPLPGDDVNQALALLVRTYAGNRLVGFEPFNEPQACAVATTGPGAALFVASYGQGGYCKNETLAALAWSNPGTVTAGDQRILGIPISTFSYHAPGMNALYSTIMQNVPAGDAAPLVFLDANYFASDPATFDNLSGSLASASNIVEVFHPYDCQDTSAATSDGHQNANCKESNPESCPTVAKNLQRYLVDPASGGPVSRPVDFDEFNFPWGEHSYQYPGPAGIYVPILTYQHGYWMNNMISAMQHDGVAGWDTFYMQNADVNDWDGSYSMFASGITPSTATPWPVNANAGPVVGAMGGQTLGCEQPPPGFG
ncbi:MAG TPA: cellulase family glycosylhydrolase [Acidimicrobiales bacterium]|nr:cellulase family glycosylhydrolase [Acidimicrobiales bacterium]